MREGDEALFHGRCPLVEVHQGRECLVHERMLPSVFQPTDNKLNQTNPIDYLEASVRLERGLIPGLLSTATDEETKSHLV